MLFDIFKKLPVQAASELLSNVVFEGSGGVPPFLYPIDEFYTLNDLS
jgi:hypothetical protein